MANLSVNIAGLTKTAMALAELGPRVMAAAAEAAYEEADYILGKALHVVPWETGALHGTGRVEEVEDEGGQLTAAVAFGNEAVDYALIVHEDLEAQHAQGEQAKYVEGPANEEMSSGRSLERMRATMAPALAGETVGKPGRFAKASVGLLQTGKPQL